MMQRLSHSPGPSITVVASGKAFVGELQYHTSPLQAIETQSGVLSTSKLRNISRSTAPGWLNIYNSVRSWPYSGGAEFPLLIRPGAFLFALENRAFDALFAHSICGEIWTAWNMLHLFGFLCTILEWVDPTTLRWIVISVPGSVSESCNFLSDHWLGGRGEREYSGEFARSVGGFGGFGGLDW